MTLTDTATMAATVRIYSDLKEQGKKLLFLGLGGSHAYGTNHAESDVDYRGVFLDSSVRFFGLNPPFNPKPYERSEPDDVVVHELGRFIKLALDNNPNILEILYTPATTFIDPLFEDILENRQKFLSQLCRRTYGGYATQQVARFERAIKGEGNDSGRFKPEHRHKHLMHCFRLIEQCTKMLETGDLDIVVTNKDELIELSVKSYDDLDFFHEEFGKRVARMDSVETQLPETPDEEFFNKLLIAIRMEYLNVQSDHPQGAARLG